MEKMRIIDKLFRGFWEKFVAKNDAKRMAKQTLPTGITEIIDIPYLPDGQKEHLLDIYYPEDSAGKKLPVIIDFHGGGLMYAYKELNKNYCYNLAKRGFVVFNVSYSLAPENRYPKCVQDAMKALRWIGKHIGDYDVCDANNVFVTGDSAGGFLAALTAAINSSVTLQGAYDVKKHGLPVKALGLTSGMFELNKSLARLQCPAIFGSGSYRKSKYKPFVDFKSVLGMATLPPCFLVTSKQDMIEGSTLFFDKLLSEKNIEHELLQFGKVKGRKLEHVFSVLYPIEYPESVQTIDAMTAFFRKHM